LADPSEVSGSEAEIEAAFQMTLGKIRKRVNAFLVLPFSRLSREQLQAELARIGSL
jgi:hypothetical protein